LCFGIALIGGFPVPLEGFGVVLLNPFAIVIPSAIENSVFIF
jgi:hypothetical protein